MIGAHAQHPAMNDEEIERLIDDHYAVEPQTLTTGAEENLRRRGHPCPKALRRDVLDVVDAEEDRGYKLVNDPRIKATIAKLERIDNLPDLIAALENINVSALASLTEEKRSEKPR